MRASAANSLMVSYLLVLAAPVAAQELPATSRYIDPAAGLTIVQAIAEG